MTKSSRLRDQAATNASAASKSLSKHSVSEKPRPTYSTRWPDWKEQQNLPKRFHENGEGVWPVIRIHDQQGVGKSAIYLVEWEPHPKTLEYWDCTWVDLEAVKAAGPDLLNEWEKQKRERESRSSRSAVPVDVARRAAPKTPATKKRKRQSAPRIIESSSDSERILSSSNLYSKPSVLPSAISSPLLLEVQETQQEVPTGDFEVRVPDARIDRQDYETLASSPISLNHSSSGLALSTKERPSHQNSQLSKSSVGVGAESAFPSPARSSGPTEDAIPSRTSFESVSLSSRPRAPSLGNTLNAISTSLAEETYRPIIEVQTTSPAATESLSDPFSSPIRGDKPPESSSSVANIPGSGLSSISVTPIPKSSDVPSRQSDVIAPSAQQIYPTIRNSQEPTDHLETISLPITASQSLQFSALQTQIPFQRTHPTQHFVKPQSPIDSPRVPKAKLLRSLIRSPSLPERHTSPRSSSSAIIRGAPRAATDSHVRLGMATSVEGSSPRLSSPRLRSATPSTDRRLEVDTGPDFRERVRRARNNHSEVKSPSVPPHRQPTHTMLGTTVTSPAQSKESTRSTSHAAESPLRNELGASAMRPEQKEPALTYSVSQQSSVYNTALGSSAMPVHRSVEDESTDLETSNTTSESDKMQIQQSIESEQLVPRTDGVMMPTLPIFGSGEYAISLPADGRVQSLYRGLIHSKKKSLLKFIRKGPSNGVRSGTKTPDSIEMAGLIERLNDSVTHVDLGLDDLGTQYPLSSQENARYANYAGSKFAFLDLLIDELKSTSLSLLIFAKPGSVHGLIESFLVMKHVARRRPSTSDSPGPEDPGHKKAQLAVELLTSGAHTDTEIVARPALIIAFDSTFDAAEYQVTQLQEKYQDPPIPILHLLVANSSEHIDRCLPNSMPSPQRLRLLVRATYQASKHLGGGPIIVPLPSDTPDDQPMDFQELQKVVKKSPERRLKVFAASLASTIKSGDFEANWRLGSLPEVEYDALEESPAKLIRARSDTPLSRAGTPSVRKRLLEVDQVNSAGAKRQRLTPLHDVTHVSDSVKDPSSQVESLQNALDAAQKQIASEMSARLVEAKNRVYAEQRLEETTHDLAGLQHRYETRTNTCHDLQKKNKVLQQQIVDAIAKHEKSIAENRVLKEQALQLKNELVTARENLKSAGGDAAALELAQERERSLTIKNAVLEKSLANTSKDFEFTRSQYQEASSKAYEFATQISELEAQAADLKVQASDEKRRLREMNYQESINQHLARVAELEQEKKSSLVVMRKLQEEVKALQKNRGVQTRGSSVQPPGSPGPRSRGGSPAPGHLGVGLGVGSILAATMGSRASVLRHER